MTAQDLVRLRRRREKQHRDRCELNDLMGNALLAAKEAPHWTITDAALYLGISKPTAYVLIRDAEARRGV